MKRQRFEANCEECPCFSYMMFIVRPRFVGRRCEANANSICNESIRWHWHLESSTLLRSFPSSLSPSLSLSLCLSQRLPHNSASGSSISPLVVSSLSRLRVRSTISDEQPAFECKNSHQNSKQWADIHRRPQPPSPQRQQASLEKQKESIQRHEECRSVCTWSMCRREPSAVVSNFSYLQP